MRRRFLLRLKADGRRARPSHPSSSAGVPFRPLEQRTTGVPHEKATLHQVIEKARDTRKAVVEKFFARRSVFRSRRRRGRRTLKI
jgi:hypothetical protein